MSGFYVVCFDVSDPRRLRRIADTLENFGVRVQRSVFECHLEISQLNDLQKQLQGLIVVEEDHVRIYSLCPKDVSKILLDGSGAVSGDPDFRVF